MNNGLIFLLGFYAGIASVGLVLWVDWWARRQTGKARKGQP